jgi:hypothetical protein
MNIFNRNKSLDDDDLPGFRERPRPKLPPVEEDIGETVQNQFAKGPLTLDQRRARLDKHLDAFSFHHSAARTEAMAYLEEHDAMIHELEAEKAKVRERLDQLDKIANGMPTFGEKDDKETVYNTSTDAVVTVSASAGKDPVSTTLDKRPIPLPSNRR